MASPQPDEPEFEPGEDDRPWSEEQWEEFMRESDLRSARFGEIFETVMDHPDRDRVIAREMGWEWLEEALDEQDAMKAAGLLDEDGNPVGEAAAGKSRKSSEPDSEEQVPEKADEDHDDPFGDDDDVEDVLADERAPGGPRGKDIPAYRLATEVGMKIHEALEPYLNSKSEGDEEFDRRIGEAGIGCHIAAAKISGGHAMGYDDDVLCGNIANCKRGLAGAEQCERALIELRDEGKLPAELVDSLLPDVRDVIRAVKDHIEALRARVWW